MKTGYHGLNYYNIFCLLLAIYVIILPEPVFALSIDTPMGNVLCTTAGWLLGNTGKGIATLGVLILGVGALLGKISWGTAMIHGVGAAVVMGAAGIISAMNAGASGC